MKINYNEVGKRIAKRRKELGLKQYEVCEMIDVNYKYLSNLETGRSAPSLELIMSLCEALQTTPDYFLVGTDKDRLIDRDIEALKAKQFSSLLEGFLPKSLVKIFAQRLGVNLTLKANQLSREKRKSLAIMLKNFEISLKSLESFDCAIITSGGINLKEINPKYMKSKLISGLYFVGEVLDIDALTGGFNMQLAFSTAVTCASDFKDLRG
jgi:predicted flavoprotein YhiN